MRILVVDDEEMIRSLADRILTRASHSVILAETGADAVRHIGADGEIDGVVLDWSLPDEPGGIILKKMRAIRPDLPCLMSSGQRVDMGDIDPELHPRTTFLEKPYRAQALIQALERLIKNHPGDR